MKNMRIGILPSLVCASVLATACSGGDGGGEPRAAIGEGCRLDEDCEEGLICADELPAQWSPEQYCTQVCSTGNPCPEGMACSTLHFGQTLCVNSCGSPFRYYNEDYDPDYACVDGVPTWCDLAPYGEYCDECGCNAGDYCDTESDPDACLPTVALGQPCESDEQCATQHCGIPASGGEMQCLAEIGTACTDDNCELCLTGGAFCTRECESESRCPEGMLCAGRSGTFWCLLDCANTDCCRIYPDCGYCRAVDSACPAGQECLPIEYEYTIVNYGCYDI